MIEKCRYILTIVDSFIEQWLLQQNIYIFIRVVPDIRPFLVSGRILHKIVDIVGNDNYFFKLKNRDKCKKEMENWMKKKKIKEKI